LEPTESRLNWSLSCCRGGWRGWDRWRGRRHSSLLLDWLMKFSVLLDLFRASIMEGD
jgi:hypothetical protein